MISKKDNKLKFTVKCNDWSDGSHSVWLWSSTSIIGSRRVYNPNWWERMRNVTLEDKIFNSGKELIKEWEKQQANRDRIKNADNHLASVLNVHLLDSATLIK